MRLNWRKAFLFPIEHATARQALLVGGIWLALLPPVGWLLALGFRKHVAFRFVDNPENVLPTWKGNIKHFLLDGMRAAGIIWVFYIPFMTIFWFTGLRSFNDLNAHLAQVILFFLATPLFVPISLPLVPLLYCHSYSWIEISSSELLTLTVLFFCTAFFMPAAFMQISVHRKFISAFNVPQMVKLVIEDFHLYLEAWLLSLSATVIALLSGPLAPWGIFWSYLTIVFAFNNALALSSNKNIRQRLQPGSAFFGTDRELFDN